MRRFVPIGFGEPCPYGEGQRSHSATLPGRMAVVVMGVRNDEGNTRAVQERGSGGALEPAQAEPAIIVCGLSALRGIRRARRIHDLWSWVPLDLEEQGRVLEAATSCKPLIDLDELARYGFWGGEETEKLELLVAAPAARRRVPHVRCCCTSRSLPGGSICRVAPGLYATSPLYTTYQYSRERAVASVAMLLFELMGTYSMAEEATMTIAWGGVWPHGERHGGGGASLDPAACGPSLALGGVRASGAGGPADQVHYACDPAFSREDLDAFIGMGRFSPRGSFARAAAVALPHAASPMESVLAAMLGAPHRLGGFALSALPGGMQLNRRIEFEHDAVLMSSGMPYAICDVYIRSANAEIEYNGIGHEEESARVHDGQRNNGMRGMGIKVIVVNREQMRDIQALEAIARSLYRDAGVRYRDVNDGRRALQDAWLNGLRAGIGMRPA